MKRLLFVAPVAMGLSACAAIGVYDSDMRFPGVVETSRKISRAGEPSSALMAFGAVGGLMYSAAGSSTQTNFYQVRVQKDLFSVQADEDFSVGSCVEIIPAKDAPFVGRAYAYGQARVVASDRCSK